MTRILADLLMKTANGLADLLPSRASRVRKKKEGK
jgi:hypothetical protein